MDGIVKEEEVIEPKKEIEESVDLKEPKVELIDVKIEEEIDDDEYKHMIPHEYRDYMEQHEQKEPGNSRKRQAEQESPLKKNTVECQVCKKDIVISTITKAKYHASTHTNIKRFSCPVVQCDYKSDVHHNVVQHMKSKHKMVKPYVKDVVRIELSDEENEELMRVLEDCFPGVTKTTRKRNSSALYKFNCQMCNISIAELSPFEKSGRRIHALTHNDIMLYECIEPECDYKTKYSTLLRQHHKYKHGKNPKLLSKLKISQEKVLEIENILVQCFPESREIDEQIRESEKMKSMINERRQQCDVCCKIVYTKDLESKDFRRFHALSHTDIMTYKCCQEDCNYMARDRCSITNHQTLVHRMGMNDMPVIRVELTYEQKMEVKRMMDQCFPEWKN